MFKRASLYARVGWPAVIALLGACASVPQDRGLSDVNQLLASRNPNLSIASATLSASAQIKQLLAQPLTPQRAVAIAFIGNPQLRLQYARLGLAQSEWLAASRLSNPQVSFAALDSNVAGEMARLGYGLVQSFTDLLFLSRRQRIADQFIAQHKAEMAAAVQNLAADVASAYFTALGAHQMEQMHSVIAHAAITAGQLAQRFHAAGNLSALELAQTQAAAEQAQLGYQATQAQAQSARVTLNTLMGLPPFSSWQLADSLPLPVAQEPSVEALVQLSLDQRLDLVAKQHELEGLAQQLGLDHTQRWVPSIVLGLEGERESDGAHLIGPTIDLELPVFGQNASQPLAAQARYEQACAEADWLVGQMSNQVTAAYARMVNARSRVHRYRNGLLPQLEAVVARSQEMQNYMLIGQFELISAKQQQYQAYQAYMETLQDYWLARVELTRAVGATLPSDGGISEPSESATVLPDQAPTRPHNGHHGNHTQPHSAEHSQEPQP